MGPACPHCDGACIWLMAMVIVLDTHVWQVRSCTLCGSLGRGGFGAVFKYIVPDGTAVAVKFQVSYLIRVRQIEGYA